MSSLHAGVVAALAAGAGAALACAGPVVPATVRATPAGRAGTGSRAERAALVRPRPLLAVLAFGGGGPSSAGRRASAPVWPVPR